MWPQRFNPLRFVGELWYIYGCQREHQSIDMKPRHANVEHHQDRSSTWNIKYGASILRLWSGVTHTGVDLLWFVMRRSGDSTSFSQVPFSSSRWLKDCCNRQDDDVVWLWTLDVMIMCFLVLWSSSRFGQSVGMDDGQTATCSVFAVHTKIWNSTVISKLWECGT